MPAQRQHTFQDSSWGSHGLLNVDIPTMLSPQGPLGQTDPASQRSYGPPHQPCLVEDLPLGAAVSVMRPLAVSNMGLIALGAVLLMGAVVTGSMLWQQASQQQQRHAFNSVQPFVVNAAPMALAAISGAPASPSPLLLPDTEKMLQEAQSKVRVLYGRDDPFSPLVSPELPASAADANSAAEAPKMPVLSFVGIIEGASGTGRLVAILKSTGELPVTYIKEPGDRFEVDGHRVMLKRVGKREVSAVIDGLVETIPLQEYSDNFSTAAPNGGSSSAVTGAGNRVSSRSIPSSPSSTVGRR